MFSTARVILPGGEIAVFVPSKAVIRDKTTDSNFVYIVDHGQARMRVVLIGEATGRFGDEYSRASPGMNP